MQKEAKRERTQKSNSKGIFFFHPPLTGHCFVVVMTAGIKSQFDTFFCDGNNSHRL
jgi:hypothetical protein